MNNKIAGLVTKLYHYVLVSFYFWLGLLKGVFIYSLIPSLVALYLTLDHMKRNPEYTESELKEVYQESYKQYQSQKVSSFLISFSFILLATSIFFLYKDEASWVWLGIASYFTLLLYATVSYATYYLAFRTMAIKTSFALGFVSVIKNLSITLSIVVLFVIMAWLAFYNIVLFVVLAPILYGLIVVYVFPKKLHN
ncbi:hypothetical protein [Amphibacillus indicireducens]|uniref:DUF624 domain-containing protein n=1 Tax=Amphibacillus indicireducens TaxID=1076330 RepID=A0ABP7V0S3_9BACI